MKLLTKRKQAWVTKRQPDVINGAVLTPSATVANRYYDRLASLIHNMTEETERKIKRMFESDHAEEYFGEDASVSSQARILTNSLMKKFNYMFSSKSKFIAEGFAKQSNKHNSAVVYSSLKELSGGLSLPTVDLDKSMKEILNATITENVSLIKSISEKYLAGVQGAVMRSITTGNGLEDLVPYLMKSKEITLRRANFIALDQTRKAMNAMSRARMENLGLEDFKWLHTGGADHPRKLHQEMSGNIYSLKNPPIIDEKTGERGLPGQLPGCRCRMQMVISFDKK